MKAEQLFRKTMPFCMAKFVLGSVMVLIDAVALALCAGIGWLFGDLGLVIGLIAWGGAIKVVHLFVMNYAGYLVKAGHIAVIAQVAATGQVPKDQVNYGKDQVIARFTAANVYFAVDKLVSGAVKQIQNQIQKVSNFLDFVPGMEQIAGVAKFFVELSLGYIDECCLGYTFYKADQGAFQSACDGVVIYAQNIKHLLKNAAFTMLKLALATVGMVIVVFIPVGILFKLLKWSGFLAFLLACLIAWVVKFAFLDSYILCQTMAGYMEVAPTTELAFDLYGTLSKISSSFRELYEKGKAEGSQWAGTNVPAPVAAYGDANPAAPVQNGAGGCFCGACGARNEAGTGYCGSCGARL